ncbi:MAG: helix-turn-helix domain-containing protein [Cytophagaceae bacterium]|nr:helix-turn-helix domain-containing protein [Cytophagaceae bacterium]
MKIVVNLDVMMAKRKMSLNELAERTKMTNVNLSILKNQKAKGVRFETLALICKFGVSLEILEMRLPALGFRLPEGSVSTLDFAKCSGVEKIVSKENKRGLLLES